MPLFASCLAATALVASPALATQRADDPKPPVTYEKRDPHGRLLFRVVFNPDGTLHHSGVAYGERAARITVSVDFDMKREPIAETRETYDPDGRIVEREDMTVNDGVEVRTRATYSYDAAGRQTTKIDVVQ